MNPLKLMLNIGVPDAKRLGIDKVRAGETVTPGTQEAYDEMVAKRWGLPAEQADAEIAAMQAMVPGVPPVALVPVQAAAQPPDFDAMSKEELTAYAADRKIDGVTPAMSKEDAAKVLKRATKVR
jgi:hypothetical protein